MDKIGRKQTMTLGFFLWGILGFTLGGALGPIQTVFPLFVVLYGIFNALGEMGRASQRSCVLPNRFQPHLEDTIWALQLP
jgi:hypothetical protein